MGTFDWLKSIFEASDTAITKQKILLDQDGQPEDFVFLEVNPAFEKMVGLERRLILNQSALSLFPYLKEDRFDWISFCGQIALEGNAKKVFVKVIHLLKKRFKVEIFSTERFFFTFLFTEIESEKRLLKPFQNPKNRYFKIFEKGNDAIFLHDDFGQIIDVNPKACQMTAYSKEELLNMSIFHLMSEKGMKATKKAKAELIRTGEVVLENQIIDREGKSVQVSVNATYLDKEHGIIMGAVRDISDLKKKEMDLENVIEGTHVGTWQWDIQEGFQIVNKHWATMLGYKHEEVNPLTTEKWQSFMHPEDLNKLEGFLNQHFKNILEQFECECRFKHKNGNWVWVLSMGRVLEWTNDGKPRLMFGTHLDITRLKQTEKELVRLNNFQEILMKMASKYINLSLSDINEAKSSSLREVGEFVKADRAYIFKYDWVNGTASNTYEWCQQGIKSEIDNLQRVPLQVMPDWVSMNKAGKLVYIEDVQKLDPEDHFRQFLEPQGIKSLLAIPIMEEGDCKGFVGFDSVREKKVYTEQEKSLLKFFSQILLNINTRSKLEKNLITEKEKALEASRAKSEFIANMSHEIRTPLNGVIGFCSILLDTELNEAQKDYTDTIMSSGRTLLEIINNILDLSKIEAGKMEFSPEKVELYKLAKNATAIVNLKIEEQSNKLICSIHKEVPKTIWIDPIRLKQILINLLSNSAKFTQKGEIELEISNCGKDEKNKICTLKFMVRDTGIGIKESNQKRILEPFTQGDYTITKKYGGTGLGLAIIKSLLTQMDSKLNVESTYGKGSQFSFILNVPYENEIPNDQHKKIKPQTTKIKSKKEKKRVLIVEDEDVNMKVAEYTLKMIDNTMDVFVAKTGKQALDFYRTIKPDIILLDLRLPDIDGYKVAKLIRRSNTEIPIIALTAMVIKGEEEKCLASGMNAFISKPIDLQIVKDVIKKYL